MAMAGSAPAIVVPPWTQTPDQRQSFMLNVPTAGPSIRMSANPYRILEAGETMNAPAVALSAAASHAVAPAPTVTLAAPSALQSTSAPAAIGSFAAAPSMLAQQVGP